MLAASKLRGTTIFATAKTLPTCSARSPRCRERAGDKQTGKAIDMALDQLKATRARAGESRSSPLPPPPARPEERYNDELASGCKRAATDAPSGLVPWAPADGFGPGRLDTAPGW